jgi:transposase
MMCPAIDNPTSCEIRAVIHFLHTKNMSAVEIHHELCAVVYGQNLMSEGTVRQWYRIFKDGWTNVHNEQQSGQPSVVNDDLVHSVEQKFVKDGTSQFQNFRVNFYRFHALLSKRLPQLD